MCGTRKGVKVGCGYLKIVLKAILPAKCLRSRRKTILLAGDCDVRPAYDTSHTGHLGEKGVALGEGRVRSLGIGFS
jgi:hypothetical protein